jgi:hypothetical protein
MMRKALLVALAWLAANLLGAAPALAEWRRAESPNFIVYSEASEAELRRQVTQLEDFDHLLRALTGTLRAPAPANKLDIYMVRGTNGLRIVSPGMSRSVGGFYTARPSGTAAFVDTTVSTGANPSEGGTLQVLFHEYAHHFMLQYFPTAYPGWYIEGFAEFMAYTRIDGAVIEYGGIGTGRAPWLTQLEWLDFDRMMFASERLRNEQILQFYAQSWLTVHYLFRDPQRRAALGRYLTAYGNGETSPQAFETAFGMRPGRLQAEVQRYAGSGQIPVTRITRTSASSPPPITVARLPASAEDLLLLQAGLRIGVGREQEAAYLALIRREAGRHAADPFAQRVLAHAEAIYGDGAAPDRLLTALLAAAPADAELLYLRGLRHRTAARAGNDAEQARQAGLWFARAHRADRNHYPTLYAFSQVRRGTDAYESENNTNILLLAHQLAPQVAPITLDTAALLMNRGQFDQAQALLLPLTADPHSRRIAEAARGLLTKARAHEAAGNDSFERTEDEDGD